MDCKVQELEAAINYWRSRRPAGGDECTLSPEVRQLARLYALMIFRGAHSVPVEQLDHGVLELLQTWRAQVAPT